MSQKVIIRWVEFGDPVEYTGVSLADAKKLCEAVGTDEAVHFRFEYFRKPMQARVDMRTVRMVTFGPQS